MANGRLSKDEQRAKVRKRSTPKASSQQHKSQITQPSLVALQNQIGNGAVQRLLAQRTALQRSGSGPTELDDETANRINRSRGGGQSLDSGVQEQMGSSMGYDFSNVRVHTSGESDQLNQELGAKAFTTGQDVFFRGGAYSPNSSSGQELIAHELTHVVQQSTGAVQSSGKMAVNEPGDRFEGEADSVAKAVMSTEATPPVQREMMPPEDELQTKREVQRQELDEEQMADAQMAQTEIAEEEALV